MQKEGNGREDANQVGGRRTRWSRERWPQAAGPRKAEHDPQRPCPQVWMGLRPRLTIVLPSLPLCQSVNDKPCCQVLATDPRPAPAGPVRICGAGSLAAVRER